MFIWMIILAAIFLSQLRNQWPVKGLQYISAIELRKMKNSTTLKIIDVRDASDFYEDHCTDAINIYVGRLPFVWSNHIRDGDTIVLLGTDHRSINKSARILNKKAGIKSIYAAFYQNINDPKINKRIICS
ncbi:MULTISPECIES: rhodanese-like domain-containing protein [Paenibacillus]|uniref:Rhodanese-like domain-containing protein n=1 Tax=Paenibacillus validus TaxID=44253 RepID=A0A7X2ZFS6_9BACL|nr:rhodanese-like domain-containing protein [Paenibacillus validus]MUG74044.1 rhodanese-like domain-containing protein [Paenibacillus validus]